MAGEPNSPAVAVESVSKAFDGRLAVDRVSFQVERGTCFALLGPNGAGKSTTLKMIYGSLRPDSGVIRVDGIDVVAEAREAKRRMGVAPQEDTLDPDLGAAQNLLFHARYCGMERDEARRRVQRFLELADLSEHEHARISELSSGMRRRLVLARSLITDPSVLFLDEPTRGLDRGSRTRYLGILAGLRQGGTTLVLATHDLDEVEALCDRAAILVRGRILHAGTAPEMAHQARLGDLLAVGEGAAAC